MIEVAGVAFVLSLKSALAFSRHVQSHYALSITPYAARFYSVGC